MDFSRLPLPPAADLYPHRCTRYRQIRELTAGKMTGSSRSTVTGITCYFETGTSVKSPGDSGVINEEQDQMDTLDKVRCPLGTGLRSGDVLLMTTGPHAGEYWEVRGDAKARAQIARYEEYRAARLPSAPKWVVS